jgi:hypothetical protein
MKPSVSLSKDSKNIFFEKYENIFHFSKTLSEKLKSEILLILKIYFSSFPKMEIIRKFSSEIKKFGIYNVDLYNEKINIHASFYYNGKLCLKLRYKFQKIRYFFIMDICYYKYNDSKTIFELFYDKYQFEGRYGFINPTISQIYRVLHRIVRDIFRTIDHLFFDYNTKVINYSTFYMKNNYGNVYQSYEKYIKYMACANIKQFENNMKFDEKYSDV